MSSTLRDQTDDELGTKSDTDELVKAIKVDFERHKQEHFELKEQLLAIVEENRRKKAVEIEDSETVRLRNEIETIRLERERFEKLWLTSQRTVLGLEKEIAEYRKQLNTPSSIVSVRNEYLAKMKEMEASLIATKRNLEEECVQKQAVEQMSRDREAKIRNLEGKLKEILIQKKEIVEKCMKTEVSLAQARNEVAAAIKERNLIEKSLDRANFEAKDRMVKETEAFAKVQEALSVAEAAIAEKEAALMREKDVKEECDYLAKTIGQVMEEAARKVDHDVADLKREHEDEVDQLQKSLSQTKKILEAETKKTKSLENKCEELSKKLESTLKSNLMLDSELHKASQTIIELELRLETLEKSASKGEESNRLLEAKTSQLEEFVNNTNKLKQHWKATMLDITAKLQAKIKDLQGDNRKLRSENHKLKSQVEKLVAWKNSRRKTPSPPPQQQQHPVES